MSIKNFLDLIAAGCEVDDSLLLRYTDTTKKKSFEMCLKYFTRNSYIEKVVIFSYAFEIVSLSGKLSRGYEI